MHAAVQLRQWRSAAGGEATYDRGMGRQSAGIGVQLVRRRETRGRPFQFHEVRFSYAAILPLIVIERYSKCVN